VVKRAAPNGGEKFYEDREDSRRMDMKYLLIAAALSLGFCGTCFAHTSMAKHHKASMSKDAPVLGKKTMPKNNCHLEGQQLICKKI
jgi:hypothetical protein